MQLFIKYFFRFLFKNKTVSFISILGLSIAIASVMVIFIYATFEFGFDKFNEKYHEIYRVQVEISHNGVNEYNAYNVNPPTGPFLKRTFPEVLEYVRIFPFKNVVLSYNDIKYEQENVLFVDSAFFKLFSYKLLSGDPENILNKPNTAVLTSSTAIKYFGNEEAIGKTLKHGTDDNYEIVGIVEDPPANSHIRFEILLSYNSSGNWMHTYNDNRWDRFWVYTYLQVRKGANINDLERSMNAELNLHKTAENINVQWKHSLQPMNDFYLNSLSNQLGDTGNGKMLKILLLVAGLILLIAYINQTNITIAQTLERLKVVSVSRVLGVKTKTIPIQFISESVFITIVCFIIALTICIFCSPVFSRILNLKFSLSILSFSAWISLFIGLLIIASVSGFYPAIVALHQKTPECLKGKARQARANVFIRKGLIIFQYSIACILIIGALVIYIQKEYMLHKNLNIDISNTIVIKGSSMNIPNNLVQTKIAILKNELKKMPYIKGLTASNAVPGNNNYRDGTYSDIQQAVDMLMFVYYHVDDEFINNYGLQLIEGRDFNKENQTDLKSSAIINEQAATALGFNSTAEAIGHMITREWDQQKFKIIGVVKDFHITKLSTNILPLVFDCSDTENRFFSVKYSGNNINNVINTISQKWETIFPGELLTYFILEDNYKDLYEREIRYGLILGIFSVLAIILSCFGLFGLSFYIIVQRTKEVGIRKINGATTTSIIQILLSDFVLLIIVSFIIACPISFYLSTKWLDEFAYKITLQFWIFALSGIITLTIAAITVSWQSWRAARRNPVESLRYE